jgi:hypothetical protein
MNKHLIPTIFKAVAVAMGIAVVAMSAIGVLASNTADLLLGIGVAALAIVALQKTE